MFSEKDVSQIAAKGLTESLVMEQINRFKHGYPSLKIIKAATVNDGIIALKDNEMSELVEYYEEDSKYLKKVKFVPASGAASRMFKYLFEVLESLDKGEKDYLKIMENQSVGSFDYIYQNRKKFAFFNELEGQLHSKNSSDDGVSNRKDVLNFLKNLLTAEGLNYANLPKGLLKFHKAR